MSVRVYVFPGLVLYDAGDEKTAVTGGWVFADSQSGANGRTTLTKESNRMNLTTTPHSNGAAGSRGGVYTNNVISLSGFNSLKVIVSTNGISYWSSTGQPVGRGKDSATAVTNNTKNGDGDGATATAHVQSAIDVTNHELIVPIASLSSGYVGVTLFVDGANYRAKGTAPFTTYIQKIILLK